MEEGQTSVTQLCVTYNTSSLIAEATYKILPWKILAEHRESFLFLKQSRILSREVKRCVKSEQWGVVKARETPGVSHQKELWCRSRCQDTWPSGDICAELIFAFGRRSLEQWQRLMSLHLVELRGTWSPPLCFMPTRASSECSLLLHHPAMATRLLCWVALCLLGIGESPEIKNLQFVHIPSSVSIYVPYPVPKLRPLPQSPHMLESPRHPGTKWQRGDKM